MFKKIALSTCCLISLTAFAGELSVKITSLTNTKGNGALEACGVVENQEGKTSLVTVKHDESVYTTLTDENGKWCQLVKRWTFRGEVNATAKTFN